MWDPEIGRAFEQLVASEGTRAVPLDPWAVEELDAFIALHEVEVRGRAFEVLEALRAEHRAADGAVRRSRATAAEPIEPAAGGDRRRARAVSVGGGPLRPGRAAGVPGRRAGSGQDGRGAGRAGGRRRLPGDRRVPRLDEAQLGARGRALAAAPLGGGHPRPLRRPAPRRHHDPQLRDRRRPPRRARPGRGRGRSSSTSRTTARTRAPSARRRSADWRRRCGPTACGWR